jgi:hypothetical protein
LRITVKIDDSQLRALERELPKRIDRGVAQVAHAHEAETIKLQRALGWKDTPASVAVQREGVGKYKVHAPVRAEDGQPYPTFQEFGTGEKAEDWNGNPRPRGRIYPKKAKKLKFTWKGQTMYRDSVAGVPAKHTFKQALDKIMPRSQEFFARGFNAPL